MLRRTKMSFLTVASICWISVNILSSLNLCYAWKPIVGAAYATSFALQQSHPEGESKIFSSNSHESKELSATSDIGFTLGNSHAGSSVGSAVPFSFHDEHFGYDDSFDAAAGSSSFGKEQCSVKKYAFNYDGTVRYNNEVPELNQFTICYWTRFTNHSGDHVILTYSVKNEPREIQFWVANAKNSSFISMAIKGQQVFRLNYPLRLSKWHHTCSSWNGKTGEWQVWLKAERIGRGFHNSLVGHKIPASGKLYSGGSSMTGEVSHGLHFEVTLVQMYRIALSAGKAHRDHKHHHAHHFDYEGHEVSTTTLPPPTINRPQPVHSLLANGQIPARTRINLAQPVQTPPAATKLPNSAFSTNFVNGQINSGSRLVTQQLVLGQPAGPGSIRKQPTTFAHLSDSYAGHDNSANVQFIDESEMRIVFKRNAQQNDTKAEPESEPEKKVAKRAAKESKLQKRGLVLLTDGNLADDSLLDFNYQYDGLAEFGGQRFKDDLAVKMNLDDEVSTHDREPAEEEVKAVMALCGSCDVEPFQGAIVLAWKDVNESMENSLKGYSVGRCGNF